MKVILINIFGFLLLTIFTTIVLLILKSLLPWWPYLIIGAIISTIICIFLQRERNNGK